jgi:hypothetical protein
VVLSQKSVTRRLSSDIEIKRRKCSPRLFPLRVERLDREQRSLFKRQNRMGKLRDSLIATDKVLKHISKEVQGVSGKFEADISNAFQLVQVGSEGVDSLYVYLTQKVKKQGKTWKEAEKQTVEDYADPNVKKFVAGIADFEKQAITFSLKWDYAFKGLEGDVKKADATLKDIEAQIAKKKKRLLQSKKFKAKMVLYEKALSNLRDGVDALVNSLNSITNDPSIAPPSPTQIKKVLNVSMKSTLAEVDNASSRTIKQLLEKYKTVKQSGEKSTRKFRQAGDFQSELKVIALMIKEADEMEEESEE